MTSCRPGGSAARQGGSGGSSVSEQDTSSHPLPSQVPLQALTAEAAELLLWPSCLVR